MVAARELGSFAPPELKIVQKPVQIQRDLSDALRQEVSLSSVYRREERRPFISYVEEFVRKLQRTQNIEYLNFGRTFQEILDMIQNGESSTEVLQKKLMVIALSIWSLRQEVVGDRLTPEVVTPIDVTEGCIYFRSDLHAIQEIEQMFEASLEVKDQGRYVVPRSQVNRQHREIRQLVQRWKVATEVLRGFDWKLDEEKIIQFLQTRGFQQQEIEITPSLLANIPQLRETVPTIEDLLKVIKQKKTITAWVGPTHNLTVSPPHWIHAQAKSSFGWNTQLMVFPELKKMGLREHGLFSHTSLEEIVQVLGLGKEAPLEFNSEPELMQYVNEVVGYSHIHPGVLLEQIITSLEGYVPAPKMEKRVVEGVLPIEKFLSVIEQLFEFEMQRCLQNSEFVRGSYERLQYMADKIRNMVALNDANGLAELLLEYKEQFHSLETAQQPNKFLEFLDRQAEIINPNLLTKLDWSLFDCVFNTPLSLLDMSKLSQNMTRAELFDIVGDRAKDWKENQKCVKCKEVKPWVGECNVCLECEAGFNEGRDMKAGWGAPKEQMSAEKLLGNRNKDTGTLFDLFLSNKETTTISKMIQFGPKETMNISQAFAA